MTTEESVRQTRIYTAVTVIALAIIVSLVWLGYKRFVTNDPTHEPTEQEKLVEATSSESEYAHVVKVALDGFAGYNIVRSDALARQLRKQKIKLELIDDKADYATRLANLQKNDVQMALYTIDSFLATGADAHDFPGTIVLIIDQSNDADAAVAYKAGVPNLDAMDHEKAKFILTGNSPSEFLGRIVVSSFNFLRLPEAWFEAKNGAAEVLAELKRTDQKTRRVFILWEPYVSQALEVPGTHMLFGSSRIKDRIVDVLVVQRQYLRDHPDVVSVIARAYLESAYSYSRSLQDLGELILSDSEKTGEKLTDTQATNLAQKIEWKTVTENYQHFGLLDDGEEQKLPLLEDMIKEITRVLVATGRLQNDPLQGKATSIVYNGILKELKESGFHPGRSREIVANAVPTDTTLPAVRIPETLTELTGAQWGSLVTVGSLKAPPLDFRPGSAELTEFMTTDLDELVSKLRSMPQFYVRVIGRTTSEGDPQANKELAAARARAVTEYLVNHGIPTHRIRAEGELLATPDAKSEVVYIVGEAPRS